MIKTWAELVSDTVDALSESAMSGNTFEKTIAKISIKHINAKSLARIATALEKLAGLTYEIEVKDNE